MYAVVETGGKQYRADAGRVHRGREAAGREVGQQITLDRVLLVVDGDQVTVGQPLVTGATVRRHCGTARRGDAR